MSKERIHCCGNGVDSSGWAYAVDTWAFPIDFRIISINEVEGKNRKYLGVVVFAEFFFSFHFF